MTPHEVTEMTAWISAAKPTSKIDPDTAKAWVPLLRDVPVEDARAVVPDLLRSVEWIGPNDIAQAVKRLRRDRLARVGFAELTPNVAPLVELEDGRVVENPAHRAEKLALRDAVASGRYGPVEVEAYRRGEMQTLTGAPPLVVGELVSRPMPALEGVARRAE